MADDSLFASEKEVIHKAESIVNGGNLPKKQLVLEYGILYFHYKKLFRQFTLLIKMSDKQEEKMHRLNKTLESQNSQLNAVSRKLSKYLSPQVYQSIFSGERDVKLESRRRKLTIFFSDIINFTGITDRLESETLTLILNSYLNEMAEIVLKYGGTIDKFIGDAIMVFFGDPNTKGDKQDALNCVMMALEMKHRIVELQQSWESYGLTHPLQVRIGISSGYCTVGNFGSDNRLDYTIIGGQVNLAARLEKVARPNEILIAQDTYSMVKDTIVCEKAEKQKVKGIAHSVQTYSVLDARDRFYHKTTRIEQELPGYQLSVDFSKLSAEDKANAIENLEDVLSTLKKL